MDKTLQIVVVAAVIMMAAAIIMFLVTGETGGLGDFIGDKKQGASCSINKTKYINACNCSNVGTAPKEEPPAGQIRSNTDSSCDWRASSNRCPTLCP